MCVSVRVMCYGSVQHNYSSTRTIFMKKLHELLDNHAKFESLDNVVKSSYVCAR